MNAIFGADHTRVSFPPHPLCFVGFGSAIFFWISMTRPHLSQRKSYLALLMAVLSEVSSRRPLSPPAVPDQRVLKMRDPHPAPGGDGSLYRVRHQARSIWRCRCWRRHQPGLRHSPFKATRPITLGAVPASPEPVVPVVGVLFFASAPAADVKELTDAEAGSLSVRLIVRVCVLGEHLHARPRDRSPDQSTAKDRYRTLNAHG